MSDNISNSVVNQIFIENLLTPITRKRKYIERSPNSTQRLENKKIKQQIDRQNKKTNEKLSNKNNNNDLNESIIEISLNGILTDINEISIRNLKQLLIKNNLNHQGNKEELKNKLKEVKIFI